MGLGGLVLRAIARPLATAATRRLPALSPLLPRLPLRPHCGFPSFPSPWILLPASDLNTYTFRHLVDHRLPKRRPSLAPRKKRAQLRPKGPFAWIRSVPGEPVPTSQPNEGSIKARGRKRKKRMRQRREFIAAEARKRKAEFVESRRRKRIERIERKMAAVAREKAWAERLVELQQLEAAKKASQAS